MWGEGTYGAGMCGAEALVGQKHLWGRMSLWDSPTEGERRVRIFHRAAVGGEMWVRTPKWPHRSLCPTAPAP